MNESNKSTEVDLELVDKILALLPDHSWTQVRQAIVTALVDNMPGSVIERLTGSYDAFDQAEAFLYSYYTLPDKQQELIIDAIKIMGASNAIELLNSLDYNKKDEVSKAASV